MNTIK